MGTIARTAYVTVCPSETNTSTCQYSQRSPLAMMLFLTSRSSSLSRRTAGWDNNSAGLDHTLLPFPQGFGADFGEGRKQVVGHAAGGGSGFDSGGHPWGQWDGRVIDFHRAFVERHGHRKNKAFGLSGSGRRLGPHVGRRRRVGQSAFCVLLGDGGGGDVYNLAVESAEAGEREGVNLDHRVLAGLDETDIEIRHKRFDLKLAA